MTASHANCDSLTHPAVLRMMAEVEARYENARDEFERDWACVWTVTREEYKQMIEDLA